MAPVRSCSKHVGVDSYSSEFIKPSQLSITANEKQWYSKILCGHVRTIYTFTLKLSMYKTSVSITLILFIYLVSSPSFPNTIHSYSSINSATLWVKLIKLILLWCLSSVHVIKTPICYSSPQHILFPQLGKSQHHLLWLNPLISDPALTFCCTNSSTGVHSLNSYCSLTI